MARRVRTIAFKPHVWAFVTSASEVLKVNLNLYVNKLLEAAISSGLASALPERVMLEFRREKLLREESELRRRSRVIMRSGAYFNDYARKALLGDERKLSFLPERRVGLYATVGEKELDVVLRLFARRKKVVEELLEVEGKLLPEERYPIALTEKGWRVGRSPEKVINKVRVGEEVKSGNGC